mgnify:CR=1 FL=1
MLDIQLFRHALDHDLHVPQICIVLCKGQQVFTSFRLLFSDKSLCDQILIVGAVFFKADRAVFCQNCRCNAVACKQHRKTDADHPLADDGNRADGIFS